MATIRTTEQLDVALDIHRRLPTLEDIRAELAKLGVMPFGAVTEKLLSSTEAIVNGHKVILADYQPTSENMVIDFAQKIRARLPETLQLHSLRLRETGTAYAEWHASDNP